jgi:hypothetical protein
MNELVEKWRIRAAEWLDLQEAADILTETKNDVFAEIKSCRRGLPKPRRNGRPASVLSGRSSETRCLPLMLRPDAPASA